MKVGDKIYCHNTRFVDNLTVGKTYKIERIYKNVFWFYDDNNWTHGYSTSKEINREYFYYKDFFYLQDDIEIRKIKLKKINDHSIIK